MEWDLSSEGSINTLTVQIDAQSVSGSGEGQAIYSMVYQNGMYFLVLNAKVITGSQTYLHTMTLGLYRQVDFCWMESIDDYSDFLNPSVHPDFSNDYFQMMITTFILVDIEWH